MSIPSRLERPLRYVMGGLYVVAGVMHLLAPNVFAQIVPPWLPRPLALVYLSGVAEVLLGLGVLVPPTRRRATQGLIALLVAVFPANVYMATHDVTLTGVLEGFRDPSEAVLWVRLPLQGVLVLWAE